MKRWMRKFGLAFRGVAAGVGGEDSFAVHLPAAALVVGLAAWFQVSSVEWAVLGLAIGLVLSLELANSALESLAKGLTNEQNRSIERALDMAAGAVLVASASALAVGLLIFGPRLWSLWSGAH